MTATVQLFTAACLCHGRLVTSSNARTSMGRTGGKDGRARRCLVRGAKRSNLALEIVLTRNARHEHLFCREILDVDDAS